MKKSRLMIALLAASLLSGCSVYSLQELREATPRGTPFQSALAMKYLAFADNEEQSYDWASSWHFADKGLTSAYGKDVEPEQPEMWTIPSEFLPQLQQAHADLIDVLTEEKKSTQPQAAAEAIFFYDCWVEQQAENWQDDEITYCHENFQSAMLTLASGALATDDNTDIPAQLSEQLSYLVYFGWNRAELDVAAEKIVSSIVADIKNDTTEYEVVLNGHTDRSGSDKYNMGLSRERAQNVKAALIARGIAARRISTFGFGETDPRTRTGDNVRDPSNRRVEVFVN